MRLRDIKPGMKFRYADNIYEVKENDVDSEIILFRNCDDLLHSLQMTYVSFKQCCDEKLITQVQYRCIWLELEDRLLRV